jgi:hypothetical protein
MAVRVLVPRALRARARRRAAAEKTLLEAASREPGWAEFWMELAYLAYDQRRYAHAIGYALQAADAPVPPTQLWRETNKYTDQPPRLISWCHEHGGDLVQALAWARRAASGSGRPMPSGTRECAGSRRRSTGQPDPPSRCTGPARSATSDDAQLRSRAARRAPGHAIHYFLRAGARGALADVMHAAGVDVVADAADYPARAERYARRST